MKGTVKKLSLEWLRKMRSENTYITSELKQKLLEVGREKKLPTSKIAKIYGVSPSYLSKFYKDNNIPVLTKQYFLTAKIPEILALANTQSTHKIAKQLGVSQSYVTTILNRGKEPTSNVKSAPKLTFEQFKTEIENKVSITMISKKYHTSVAVVKGLYKRYYTTVLQKDLENLSSADLQHLEKIGVCPFEAGSKCLQCPFADCITSEVSVTKEEMTFVHNALKNITTELLNDSYTGRLIPTN